MAINFGKLAQVVDVKKISPQKFPDAGTIIFNARSCKDQADTISFNELSVETEEAIVVQFKPPYSAFLFSRSSIVINRCFVFAKVCINVMGPLEVC